ncbi:NosD domain-containing protein [Streptomyces sp. DSM 41987]|uniref:NosD domain-containing protein n=1 Tax=Streptomyces TaxID=1883 RepID=UPI0018DF6EA6|nr:right-handed parallel beta-helix repeat-containing protein [Streptomyces fildesensis]
MGGIIKTRTGMLSAAVLLGAIALPAAGAPGAAAVPANIYVDNAAAAHCSNAGTGLQDQPFCTVQAAADASLPGQTVHIATGTYPEQVSITKSGTAAAPITFTGDVSEWGSIQDAAIIGSYEATGGTARALSVTNAEHIRIKDLNFDAVDEGVHVEGSKDVSVINGTVAGAQSVALRVTGASEDVTLGKFNLWANSGAGVAVEAGARRTVVTGNSLNANVRGISVTDAPNTVIVGNSVYSHCQDGIVLAGTSPNATIENNVVTTDNYSGTSDGCSATTRVMVEAASVPGTKTDYNVINTSNGEQAYNWSGTKYANRAAFTTATGQGARDVFADPTVPNEGDRHAKPLPTVDSADENAPGMLTTDVYRTAALDDPITPNTGTGSGYRDRGAEEMGNLGSVYTPAGPTRVLDTRDGTGAPKGLLNSWMDVQLGGKAGVPAAGVTAVTLNVTVTGSTGAGYLKVFAAGTGSLSSVLNWTAGETIANLVTVPVSEDGKVTFEYFGAGMGAHVIADVEGYYSAKGSVFHETSPARALDTRDGTGAPKGAVKAGGTVNLQVTGAKGVPASGVTAVTLNVTVTGSTGQGFLTVYPHGQARPTASNINWPAGKTIANLVTVPVVDGKVALYVAGGGNTTQVIADVAGYFDATGHNTYRSYFTERLMDTREPTTDGCTDKTRPASAIPAGGTLEITNCLPWVTGLTLNVTVTQPGAGGFLTVYPSGQARPLASNLNWNAGETIPNAVVVKVGKGGKVAFYNGSTKPIHLVVDQFGYQAV